MIGRIVRPADFERVLGAPQRSLSTHFAVHHVAGAPSSARRPVEAGLPPGPATASSALVPGLSTDLSTGAAQHGASPVDDSPQVGAAAGLWLGLVVPKRHARRAVTRNLIKRQVREAMRLHGPRLPQGLWVVRLRAPFDRVAYPSPGSDALRADTRQELAQLFERAITAPLPPVARRPRHPRKR